MDVTIEQLIDFKFDSNIEKAASFFHVSTSTIYRWIKNNQLPSHAQSKLLSFNHSLEDLSNDWQGWRLYPDGLLAENGIFVHVDQLAAYADWLKEERKQFNIKAAEYMKIRHCKYRRWQYMRSQN
jgi:hypothetical protein